MITCDVFPKKEALREIRPGMRFRANFDRNYLMFSTDADYDDDVTDPFDTREIFDLIREINDPEHPLTLEQLNVVTEEQVSHKLNRGI